MHNHVTRYSYVLSTVALLSLGLGQKSAHAQTASFVSQPLAALAGQLLGQSQSGSQVVSVQVMDPSGVLPVSGASVTVSLNNPNGATLGGTVTKTTNALGVATFNDLKVVKAGAGYVLKAVTGTTTGLSNVFNILPGQPAAVSPPQVPSTAVAGQAMSAVSAVATDAYGNVVPNASVSVALGNANGATLAGTLTKTTDATGKATFGDLSVAKAGTGYTIGATVNGVTANSPSFSVTPGPLATLAFSQQPSGAVAGQTLAGVTVLGTDASGNVVPSASISLNLNNGGNGATLAGTTPVISDSNGVATFGDLSISQAGTGYTLTASSGSVSATTSAFGVTPAPALTWTAVANSTGADGYTRILWDRSDGRASVWKVDSSGNLISQQQFGPYDGWTAKTIATGQDTDTRLLWTHTSGKAAFYLLDRDNAFVYQQQYGPYNGWTAQSLAVEPDNTVRALWTNVDGTATVWTMDASNTLKGGEQYGPYTGWSAKDLTVNPDGTERLLWNNSNGTATIWRLNSGSRLLDQKQYGPYTGYTARSISAVSDGTARVVWTHTDSHIALWTVDASNTYTGQTQLGSASSGWTFQDLSIGADGNSRLLFVSPTGQSLLSSMTPAGSVAVNKQYGPY